MRNIILEYSFNPQDEIRRYYIPNGPIRPYNHKFPKTLIGGRVRHLNPSWLDKHPTWLDYSIQNDVVFCLCCYLFANVRENQHGDLVSKGF